MAPVVIISSAENLVSWLRIKANKIDLQIICLRSILECVISAIGNSALIILRTHTLEIRMKFPAETGIRNQVKTG